MSTPNLKALPATGYVRESQLIPEIVPISSATLWRWCKAGRFPKPQKLGPRVTAWNVSDVRAWMTSKEAANG
jgi:predicted DNA-binding transcriptional regulator AlpA